MIFALLTLMATDQSGDEVVIVRAERLKTARTDSAVISLSGAALQDQAVVRLDEALRSVPGIGLFRRTSSGAANATIQGISLRPIAPNGAGRALVSLDGIPQNDPFGGWINWGRYDPLFLERVDIARGGAGAGYGPMALTGTLDLVEARGQPAMGQMSFGSFGSAHIASRASFRSEDAVFTAMATYDKSDGDFSIAKAKRGLVDEPVRSDLFGASLVTDIARPNGAWSFRASAFNEAKGAGIAGGQSRAQGLDVSAARRIEGAWGQARVLVYAQGRDFSNQAVSVVLGRASVTPTLDQVATPASAIGGSIVAQGAYGTPWPRLTLDWRRAQGDTQELFRYVGSAFTRSRIAGGRQDLVGLGLAVPRPLRIGQSRMTLEGAIRLDYWANGDARRLETDRANGIVTLIVRPVNQSDAVVNGRLSLSAGPASLTAYRTYRPPTLNELHRPFRLGNDVTEANANLRPETLSGVDFDLQFNRSLLGGMLSSQMSLYANRLYGPITNVTLATGPGTFPRVGFLPAGGALRERQNAGQIDALGLEARLDWASVTNRETYHVAVSMTDARVEGGARVPQLTGKRPAQAPRWSASLGASWRVGLNTRLNAMVRGEGKRFDDDLNTRILPGYGTLDLRIDHKITARSSLYISAENLLGAPVATARAGDGLANFTQSRILRLGVKFAR
jgi:outer membrane cobalamin receptor